MSSAHRLHARKTLWMYRTTRMANAMRNADLDAWVGEHTRLAEWGD